MAVAVAAVLLIRSLAFTSCTIPHSGEAPTLYAGDRVIVSRWSYGLRLPLEGLFGYHRIGECPVKRGDMVIFNNPAGKERLISDRALYVGRCIALPGDTLMLNSEHLCSQSADALPFVVPSKGSHVMVHPWNVKLLCNTVNKHEHRRATLRGDSLLIDGKPVAEVLFTKDYYWMLDSNIVNLADSRLFGFVPHDHLVGRATLVWFSKDPKRPFWRGYRWNRMIRAVE